MTRLSGEIDAVNPRPVPAGIFFLIFPAGAATPILAAAPGRGLAVAGRAADICRGSPGAWVPPRIPQWTL